MKLIFLSLFQLYEDISYGKILPLWRTKGTSDWREVHRQRNEEVSLDKLRQFGRARHIRATPLIRTLRQFSTKTYWSPENWRNEIIIKNKIQWPPLNWITDNWICRLIESDCIGPDQTSINISEIHRLIETKSAKSRLFALLLK